MGFEYNDIYIASLEASSSPLSGYLDLLQVSHYQAFQWLLTNPLSFEETLEAVKQGAPREHMLANILASKDITAEDRHQLYLTNPDIFIHAGIDPLNTSLFPTQATVEILTAETTSTQDLSDCSYDLNYMPPQTRAALLKNKKWVKKICDHIEGLPDSTSYEAQPLAVFTAHASSDDTAQYWGTILTVLSRTQVLGSGFTEYVRSLLTNPDLADLDVLANIQRILESYAGQAQRILDLDDEGDLYSNLRVAPEFTWFR